MSDRPLDVASTNRHAPDWLILCIACIAQFMVVLDVSIVNVALAANGSRSALHPEQRPMGRECLRLDLRRLLAVGRARLRLLRSTPCLHHGHHHLHPRQYRRRYRTDRHADDHDPCHSRYWRRHPLAGDLDHHRHDLPRTTSPQGHRCVERGRRRRRRGWWTLGRDPDGLGLVALGLLHQCALRHRGRHRRGDVPARDAQPRRHHQARRHRFGAGHRRTGLGDLRGREYDESRLDLTDHPRMAHLGDSRCSRPSSSGRPKWRRTHSCRSASSSLDRSPWRI